MLSWIQKELHLHYGAGVKNVHLCGHVSASSTRVTWNLPKCGQTSVKSLKKTTKNKLVKNLFLINLSFYLVGLYLMTLRSERVVLYC